MESMGTIVLRQVEADKLLTGLGRDGAGVREFVWNYFAATGNLEAYLLYRDIEVTRDSHTLSREIFEQGDLNRHRIRGQEGTPDSDMLSAAFSMVPPPLSSSSPSIVPSST
ncbi:YqzL family protein [Pasteuria penetrans]|uniref:YqzL family protein n=1 Tax=Pasteuria penetrans TaxID=86005 RepID=UPI0024825392|nr:YqzL family protein [Pasteuria penetrans]